MLPAMNSLEAEYSFLAPTWKLPPVASSSIYARSYGNSYGPLESGLGPDWPTWNSTRYNARYIPSYVPTMSARRTYPIPVNYQRVVSREIPQSYFAQPPLPQTQQQQPQPYQQQQPQPYQQQQQPQPYQQQPPPYYPEPEEEARQPGPSYYQPPINHFGDKTAPDDGRNLTISLHPNNGYDANRQSHPSKPGHVQQRNLPINRGLTYATNDQAAIPPPPPPPQASQRRRVQIADSNRQTPSTVINDYGQGKNSRNSNPTPTYSNQNGTPEPTLPQQRYRPPAGSIPPSSSVSHQRRDYSDDSRNENKVKIHDYLYGLAAPDPGSYVNAYKNHQRRLQDEKLGRKSVMSEYKSFAQNGGFGPTFGSTNQHAYEEKLDTEKKRRSYSKVVRESNYHKIEEQKRAQMISGQQKTRPVPIPKSRRAREYADTIERPHHMRPVVRLRDPTSGNVIIRDLPYEHDQRIPS